MHLQEPMELGEIYNYVPFLATRYLSLAGSLWLMTSLTSSDGVREAVGTSMGAFTGWGLRALSLASLLGPDSSWISEKAMATQSSTLAWKIPRMEEPCRLQSIGSLGVRHNWVTSLSLFTFMHWRRKRQATPVFLPGESHGWGSLVGCHLWGHTESDMTEATQQQQQQQLNLCGVLLHIESFHCISVGKCRVLLRFPAEMCLSESGWDRMAWTFQSLKPVTFPS